MIKANNLLLSIIALLFVFNSSAVWYGFDRLPLVATSDEVFTNDPAISLVRGYGFIAKSLSGTLNFENAFGHYPPVYPFFQALLFHIFGISPFTLRCTSIIFYIFSMAGITFIFFRLSQIGVFNIFSFFLIALLYLSNPTSFSLARHGHPDSMALFFGILTFILLLSKAGVTPRKKRWVLAAIMMGLSVSTHFQAVILWLIFVILLLFRFARRNLKFALFLTLLPLFILAGIWIAANTTKSYIAALQFYRISSLFLIKTGTEIIRLLMWGDRGLLGFLTAFIRSGYWTFILLLFSWIVLLTRSILEIKRKGLRGLLNNKWLIILFSINLVSSVFILFTNLSAYRLGTIFPIALAGVGVALPNMGFRSPAQKIIFGFIIFLVLCGLTINTIYILRVRAEWARRAPNRFFNFVRSLPLKTKIATVFPLWFEFVRQGRSVQVIYLGPPIQYVDYYRKHPKYLDNFDILILFASEPPPPILLSRRTRLLEIGQEKFMIFEKKN